MSALEEAKRARESGYAGLSQVEISRRPQLDGLFGRPRWWLRCERRLLRATPLLPDRPVLSSDGCRSDAFVPERIWGKYVRSS